MTTTLLAGAGQVAAILKEDELEEEDDIDEDLHVDQVPSILPRVSWQIFQHSWKIFQGNVTNIFQENDWNQLTTSNDDIAFF